MALAALVLIVLIVALTSGGTGSGAGKGRHGELALDGSRSNQATTTAGTSGHAQRSHAQRIRHKASPAPRAAQTPPLSRAAQLQQAGHVLLAEGRYAAAIPELRAALSASGESATNCGEPSTPGCVAYAEALYDLGRALRLDNAPAAAGAVLRERLRIDTQRAAVQHELGLNRRRRASAPASHRPSHARTPHQTTTSPSPAPEHHPNPGGASAPVQTQAETGAGAHTSPSAGAQQSAPGGSTAP